MCVGGVGGLPATVVMPHEADPGGHKRAARGILELCSQRGPTVIRLLRAMDPSPALA
jgi:hypothetical protein